MMNRKNMLSVLLALPLSASAQQITAINETIDCGQVMYKHPVTVEYEIKNTGREPLVIQKVLTDCGCTTAEFPRQAIAPDEKGVVKATYDAKQMGHFHKQIGIYSNGSQQPLMLTIKGVIVDEIVDFEGDYPFSLGLLKTDLNNIEFDDVNRGDRPLVKMHIKNTTKDMAQPVVMHLPNYLKADVSPSKIAPGHAGVATIMLDSKMIRDYGLSQTSVYLGFAPGDKVSEDKEIIVSTVLLPDFHGADDGAVVPRPKMLLSTKTLDLGTFGTKKRLKGQILIENLGPAELDIENVQMYTRGLSLSLSKSKLQPGERAKMKITAVADDIRKARNKPRVLMITNDPENAKVIIDIQVK